MKCEYCNNDFSSIYTLKKHQKKAKYCINMQTSLINLIKDKELNILRQKLEEIEKKENQFQEKILHILEQSINKPKNITNNIINNTNNILLAPFNLTSDIIKEKILKFTDKHLRKGQVGAAKFVATDLLMNDKGEPIYKCTDLSRKAFHYLDEEGKQVKDYEAENLINLIKEPLVNRSYDILKTKEKLPYERYSIYGNGVKDIEALSEDSHKFTKKLGVLTVNFSKSVIDDRFIILTDDENEVVISEDVSNNELQKKWYILVNGEFISDNES